MTLAPAFYEATVQIIPVFMLALLVEEAVSDRTGSRRERRRHGTLVAAFTVDGLLGFGLALGVLGFGRDDPLVAALVILGLGSVVSAVLLVHFTRLEAAPRTAFVVGFSPFLVAGVTGFGVLIAA